MLIKCSAPVESFRGKLGGLDGIVGYPVGGRMFGRNMVVPANPNTTMQQLVRGYLAAGAVAFQSVTKIEKADWESLAENVILADKYGQKFTPSAIQLYQRVNMYRQLDGQAITDTAPAYDIQPAATSVAGTIAAGDLQIDITHSNTPADVIFAVRVTDTLPSAVRNARENELRYIDASPADCIAPGGVSPQSVTMDMDNFTVAIGDYIGVEIVSLSDAYLPGGTLFDSSMQLT